MIIIKTTKGIASQFDLNNTFENEHFEIQYERNVFGMSELDAVITFIISSIYSGIAYDFLRNGVIKLSSKLFSKKINIIIKYSDLSFFKISDDQIILIEGGKVNEIENMDEMFKILESKINKS